MSYFIAVLIILSVDFCVIFKGAKSEKNTVVFMSRTDRESVRKMRKLKSMGIEVFFAGKTNITNALKKGVMKNGDCFVTEREFRMLTKKEKEKLISFCRVYLMFGDMQEIKSLIERRYAVLDMENADIINFYSRSVLQMIMDFIFLTEVSIISAVIAHKLMTFLL